MKLSTKRGVLFCVVGVIATALMLSSSTIANAAVAVDTPDPLAAVAQVAPETVSKAADVVTTDTGTNAVAAAVSGTDVTVPVDPASVISLGLGSDVLSIGLPFGDTADNAIVEKPGVVSYDNNNGSTTVPVVEKDGALQINTIIENASAPTRYSYNLTIPTGGQIVPAGQGFFIVNADTEPVTFIAEPWAKDANGSAVATHYELNGSTLTQVVDHTAMSVVYPVVADPKFAWYGILPSVKTTRSETAALRGIGAGPAGVGAAARACQVFVAAAGIAGAVICGLNIVSIMFNATRIYGEGKCAQLLIGPGVISTISYKDSYCR